MSGAGRRQFLLATLALPLARAVSARPACAARVEAAVKLKWAHVYETSEPFHSAALWASEELQKRTNGRFKVEVFPASSLGKESDLNQSLSLATVEIITSGVAFAARRYPRLGIAYYPFLFRDADHLLAYAKSDVFREITEGFRAQTGIAMIAYAYYGTRHVSAQKPFGDCTGMAGLKIRVPDAAVYSVMPRACGANPTPIAFAEVYLALQNGTVDAQENPLTTILAKKLYEVQKHIMLTGHVVDGVATQVAPHVWNRLGSADQELFTQVAREAAARASAEIRQREVELVSEFRGRGLGVHEVDRASFAGAVSRTVSVASLGYEQRDYERIVSLP